MMDKKKTLLSITTYLVSLIIFSPCYPINTTPQRINIFNSLSNIEKYAKQLPEYPSPNNNNWQNPDFSSTYQQITTNFVSNFFSRLSIYTPVWSIYSFNRLLESIVTKRTELGYKNKFIQKVYVKPGSTVIVFGALYGAFHSLVRDLAFLKQKRIIDENLHIIQPDCMLVFIGNVVAYSPYILETLTVILRLMINNPHNVFYIKGDQEDQENWKKDGLKNELQIRASYYKNGDIPLSSLLNNFFETLPIALYLIDGITPAQIDVLRISSTPHEKKLNENLFTQFFFNPKEHIIEINDLITAKPNGHINVAAYICGSPNEQEKHRATHGLALITKIKQAPVWNLFSSPTGANRALYQFFYDSFIEITTAPLLKDWTITLYERDVRTNEGIKPYVITNLLTGVEYINKEMQEELSNKLSKQIKDEEQRINQLQQKFTQFEQEKTQEFTEKSVIVAEDVKPQEPATPIETVEEKEIQFGTSMDLSRGIADICKQALAGMELAFHTQNKQGGINGKKITIKALDDEYTPRLAINNIQTLLNTYNIDQIIYPCGTPTLAAYFKLVEQGKILVLFALSGSHIFRSPSYKYIIHYRSSYISESEALARYAIETLKAQKIALIYQNDVPSTQGAVEYFKRIGFKNYFDVTYNREDINMDQQAKLINKENPDALIFLSIATATIEIIRQGGTKIMGTKHLLGWSDLGSGLFQKFIQQEDLKFVISNGVPSPLHSQLPIVKEFRRLADTHNIVKDSFALEGFICGSIAIEILKKIQGKVTKEKIIEIAEKFFNFDLGGITLTFNWKTRELCPTIWLDTGTGDWTPITFEVPAPTAAQLMEKPAAKK